MASITTYFNTSGGGGSVSGTATRVAFFGGTPGNPSTTLDDSANLNWDDTNSRFSVGDATTVGSTVTIAGAGDTDATSALEVRTDSTYGNLLHFKLYNNGRIDSRMISSTGTLTSNVAIGVDAGASITTGNRNVLLGDSAGAAIVGGSDNVLFGTLAGESIVSGTYNTVVGPNAGRSIASGYNNTLIGRTAGDNITSGFDNVAVGREAGNGTTTGSLNISVGFQAGKERQTGASGSPNSGSTSSIYIGNQTKALTATDTNAIVIGNAALSNGSNTTVIGNSSTTDAYINGNINIYDTKNIVFDSGTGTKIGTSNTQKLAFYGTTPIVQPTTAVGSATVVSPGAGNVVKTDDTFDGYTLAQIVKALRNIGVLQ